MNDGEYSDIVQSLGNVRAAIMGKELTDVGWDLRDELLSLQEILATVATVVYQRFSTRTNARDALAADLKEIGEAVDAAGGSSLVATPAFIAEQAKALAAYRAFADSLSLEGHKSHAEALQTLKSNTASLADDRESRDAIIELVKTSVECWFLSAPPAIRAWMAGVVFTRFARERHNASFQMPGKYDGSIDEGCRKLLRQEHEALGELLAAIKAHGEGK